MIREEIVKKRKALGWSQTKLGEECGVSLRTIVNVEQEKNLSFSLLKKVCEVLGLELRLIDISPVQQSEKKKKEETSSRVINILD